MTPKPALLHIGTPKTGTTSIQNAEVWEYLSGQDVIADFAAAAAKRTLPLRVAAHVYRSVPHDRRPARLDA